VESEEYAPSKKELSAKEKLFYFILYLFNSILGKEKLHPSVIFTLLIFAFIIILALSVLYFVFPTTGTGSILGFILLLSSLIILAAFLYVFQKKAEII